MSHAPSPVRPLPELSSGGAELWVKDDGHLHPVYGGNKARKLPRILAAAEARGARRILTFGPAGSHHVLSAALLAKERGLPTAAVLTPQPATEHAVEMLRAIVAQSVALHPASGVRQVPWSFVKALRRGDYVVPPGASSELGASAYADAVAELRDQIAAGELPEPDAIVVALGSGGTAAGLVAGVIEQRLKAEVIGVQTVGGELARPYALHLARRLLARRALGAGDLARRFRVERAALGPGYGQPTRASERAAVEARAAGLVTDPTYTAKAFGEALALARAPGRPRVILYWHTLSAAPLEPLSAAAPAFDALPVELRRLLTPVLAEPSHPGPRRMR